MREINTVRDGNDDHQTEITVKTIGAAPPFRLIVPSSLKDYVCQMCGVEGYKQCLVPCYSCGAYEHMYCMEKVIMKVPKEWQCDYCQRKTQDHLVGRGIDRIRDEFPLGPSKCSSWKGRFKILDEKFMDLHCDLKAHLPTTVKKRIYKFSIKMPEEVELTMVPRSNLGMSPTKDDISLYFFCGHNLGCIRYNQILQQLEAKDYVMRSKMNGVELIVLSSRLLPLDSQFYLGRWPFMWAVLRSIRKHKNLNELSTTSIQVMETRSFLPPPGIAMTYDV
ncbi:uncharacterized protein LOC124927839 [Impatiens glandulifera]|uniref:uncharacterized protein LOC124927839 n=1 Tax=Impatiens glandulifera TaxID=253017 RepID=UPI001FB11B2A|nr:uncharacterized protein LOC124927839 [Impatiens glandulifera]